MSLNEQLDQLRKKIIGSLPESSAELKLSGNREILSMFLESKALKQGDPVPDATVYNQELEKILIPDLLKDQNLVVSFYRGTWCPYCNLELKALSEIYDQIRDRNAELLAISPELVKFTKEMLDENKYKFPFFYDLNNKAAAEFGLVFELPEDLRELYNELSIDLQQRNGDNSWVLPMPATFIISKDGQIRSTYVNADYTTRMEPEDILKELDKLN